MNTGNLADVLYHSDTKVINLGKFHLTNNQINELVSRTLDWLQAVGEPRPGSPAGQVLDLLASCYMDSPKEIIQ